MIVFIAGMQRSGSTFTFNVVRELLELTGPVYTEASNDLSGAISRISGASHLVLKDHVGSPRINSFVFNGQAKAICTVRSVEAAISSWMDTFGFSLSEAILHVKGWVSLYRDIAPFAKTFRYSEIESRPEDIVREIDRFLGFHTDEGTLVMIASKFSKENVRRIVDSITIDSPGVQDIGFSYYDKKTMFHRRHIGRSDRRSP